MNKKSIIALTSAAVLTVGMTIGSYAWFTGSATAKGNTFSTGTLGIQNSITAGVPGTDGELTPNGKLSLTNMQPGDYETFKYSVNNLKEANKDATFSTLDLVYKNAVTSDLVAKTPYSSLIEVAKFDLKVTGNGATLNDKSALDTLNGTKLDYATLQTRLQQEVKLNGGSKSDVTYEIKVILPTELTAGSVNDNLYQNKPGQINISTVAKQTNGQY